MSSRFRPLIGPLLMLTVALAGCSDGGSSGGGGASALNAARTGTVTFSIPAASAKTAAKISDGAVTFRIDILNPNNQQSILPSVTATRSATGTQVVSITNVPAGSVLFVITSFDVNGNALDLGVVTLNIQPGASVASVVTLNPIGGGNGTLGNLNAAFARLALADYAGARDLFQSALAGSLSAADQDAARFFLAATKIVALFQELDSNSPSPPPTTFTTLGEFLDAAGFDPNSRSSVKTLQGPAVFPGTTPTVPQAMTFLTGRFTTELQSSIQLLNQVNPSFSRQYSVNTGVPGAPVSTLTVISDEADVLALRGFAEGALATVQFVSSYNLGGNFTTAINNKTLTKQSYLNSNANILTVSNGTNLPTASQNYSAAATDGVAAIQFIQNRTGSQAMNLLSLANSSPARIQKTILALNKAKQSLASATTISSQGDTANVNFLPLFTNTGTDLRPFLPTFVGPDADSLIPSSGFSSIYGGFGAFAALDPNTIVAYASQLLIDGSSLANCFVTQTQINGFDPHIQITSVSSGSSVSGVLIGHLLLPGGSLQPVTLTWSSVPALNLAPNGTFSYTSGATQHSTTATATIGPVVVGHVRIDGDF